MQTATLVSYACLTAWGLLGAGALTSSVYLAGLAAMAEQGRRRQGRRATLPPGEVPFLVVLIPAHNEELVLVATLTSLIQQSYPREHFEIVVVADNCTDTTAELARQREVSVFERVDPEKRGKGYALEWAMARLWERERKPDAVVIVDADTKVASNFLLVMAGRLFEGVAPAQWAGHQRVLQGRYGVLNGAESWRALLMEGAFELVNHIKPLGRSALGFSVGLKGNGMGFTRAVLEAAPWRGHSITEDIDYGLDLLLHQRLAVGYLPEAVVRAQMPNSAGQAASQRARWERGRYRLLRERALPLLWAGLRRGDLRLVDASFDLVVPPLAELAALHAAWLGLTFLGLKMGTLVGAWPLVPLVSLACYAGYILGGLRVAEASPAVYGALARAPFYALWKFALYFLPRRKRAAGGAEEWVRTERAPLASTPSSTERELEDAA